MIMNTQAKWKLQNLVRLEHQKKQAAFSLKTGVKYHVGKNPSIRPWKATKPKITVLGKHRLTHGDTKAAKWKPT